MKLDVLTRDLQGCNDEKKKVELEYKYLQSKYNTLTDDFQKCNNERKSLQISLEVSKKDCKNEKDRVMQKFQWHPHERRVKRGHKCKKRHR